MWSALVFLAGMIFLRMASKDMKKSSKERSRQNRNRVARNIATGTGRNIPSHQRTRCTQRPNSVRYTQLRRPVRRDPGNRNSIHRPVRTVLSA